MTPVELVTTSNFDTVRDTTRTSELNVHDESIENHELLEYRQS